MTENILPTGYDIVPTRECVAAGMNTKQRRGFGPDIIHGIYVAFQKGLIKGIVTKLRFFVVFHTLLIHILREVIFDPSNLRHYLT